MGRTRKERVYELLVRHTKEQYILHKKEMKGLTTEEVALCLGISRANASLELNTLVKEKFALKIKRKPVLFFAKLMLEELFSLSITQNQFSEFQEIFEEHSSKTTEISDTFHLIGKNASLKKHIEMAKAAVLYPPQGLNILLTGATGVGKSLFAEEIYKFGIRNSILQQNAPFIVFNCADYAENKQLLLSQLFGYVKGAFTGAVEEHKGLVEQAENGILFLDEIHRLPEEGQEMLFLLMDKGIYRKLGETSFVRKSRIMIIGATTESPDRTMLTTFLRRMPIMIQLPTLEERTSQERLELIFSMFNQESQRINKLIFVRKEVLCALLLYKCKFNIGQLKSDIQVICSRAFLETITNQNEVVEVELHHLPKSIYESLALKKQNKEVLNLLGHMSSAVVKFPQDFNDQRKSISEKTKHIHTDIFNKMNSLNDNSQKSWLNIQNSTRKNKIFSGETVQDQLINQQIFGIVTQILSNYSEWEQKINVEQYYAVIALHLQRVVEAVQIGEKISNKTQLAEYNQDPKDTLVALKILEELERVFQVHFDHWDTVYLSKFLHLTKKHQSESFIQLLVIMHGETTASSMAKFSNELLQTNHIHAINMKLTDTVELILKKAVNKCKEIDKGKGVLILADMGSILGFGREISSKLNIDVKVLDMVSTPILLEAGRKSLNIETDLKHLVQELENIRKNYYLEMGQTSSPYATRYFDSVLIENMKGVLTFLDAEKAYGYLKDTVDRILLRLNFNCSDDFLVKFIFHTSSMLERCILKEYLSYKDWEDRFFEYPFISLIIKEEFSLIQEIFGIRIPDEEFATIIDIFILQFPIKSIR